MRTAGLRVAPDRHGGKGAAFRGGPIADPFDPAGHVERSGQTGISGLPLSNREIDILRCLLDGDPNKVISQRLRIADATVKVHIKAILRKLNVQNRTQAAMWAASRGLTLSRAKAPRELVAAHMQSDAPKPVARVS